ncbi:signal transduction histidine kinase [Clostridium tetanomorphum]|uniref:histidine kinase n=2 Tax=Clostridium tetanomorphum TaxID=1553 RepID=A0A923IZZ1_CLOTT|nr:HAMP domain-containing sensor histidine kinase [Clostridium tetanomorphum]KAJ49118.1 histidine kinase [Clostridium tetanomorphum DSM 665]KAJ50234.1 histidine kinase [Clostridium tetanomorphum DSM 665]MBC2396205.1 HAMP domain-containing histidine kinase [Clostridium tetanomorphum]MBP1864374.1 signal transduction histidine kinase [Clostridium tetanomorphum]NRS83820.1 signal transduction histidine kinase [Clostridium tetanomorphum]
MIYLVLVLSILVVYLGFRTFYADMQIKSLINQLTDINENKTHSKLTIGLLNKKIEKLTLKINEIIQLKKQSEGSKIKLERDLRKTIANISHDLRTPLTSIIGYIQFLKLDNISEAEKNEYVVIAEKRAKSLENLLNDFYELSLIESMDYELQSEKININRIVEEVVLGKYADFMNKGINPTVEIPKENVYILGDAKAFERIIENLLGNTVKYAKDRVSISLQVEKNKTFIKVSNNVDNISKEDVQKVFDRFYMADKTRNGKGTGLGLSIAKGLIEKMNGQISASLKGDEFTIIMEVLIM